jgi:hypothetical protein
MLNVLKNGMVTLTSEIMTVTTIIGIFCVIMS